MHVVPKIWIDQLEPTHLLRGFDETRERKRNDTPDEDSVQGLVAVIPGSPKDKSSCTATSMGKNHLAVEYRSNTAVTGMLPCSGIKVQRVAHRHRQTRGENGPYRQSLFSLAARCLHRPRGGP